MDGRNFLSSIFLFSNNDKGVKAIECKNPSALSFIFVAFAKKFFPASSAPYFSI